MIVLLLFVLLLVLDLLLVVPVGAADSQNASVKTEGDTVSVMSGPGGNAPKASDGCDELAGKLDCAVPAGIGRGGTSSGTATGRGGASSVKTGCKRRHSSL
jgi:hypothetical protein